MNKKEEQIDVVGHISLKNYLQNVELACLLNKECTAPNAESTWLTFSRNYEIGSEEFANYDNPDYLKDFYFRLQKSLEGDNYLDEEELAIMKKADVTNQELYILFIKGWDLEFF